MSKISCNIDAFRHSDKPYTYAFKQLSELGFDAVEPEFLDGRCIYTIYHFCPMISSDDDPLEIKKLASDLGLEISCLSAHTSLLNTEYGTRYLKRAIKFADKLNTPIVNTSEGPKPPEMSDEDAFNIMKYTLKETIKMAKNYNMKISIEPHGEYTTNAQGLKKILKLVDSELFGINFDTGNTFLAGSDPVSTLKEVADEVIYIHVKDIGGVLLGERGKITGTPVGVAVGKGNVDIKGCISILKSTGYNGVYSIEAGEADLKESLQYLRSIT